MYFNTLLILVSCLLAGLSLAVNPSYCYRDNCLRALAATQRAVFASSDCTSFLAVRTVTAAPIIDPSATPTIPRPVISGFPAYAIACSGAVRFASACSCIGIHPGNYTVTVSASTVPTTTTHVPTSTTSSNPPTCTANTLIDPLNCGTCGNVCLSGTCENGVCTSSQCTAQVCGGFTNCNNNSNCFCFSSTDNTNGFCGANAVCRGLTACASDIDCEIVGSTGNICAVNTCCPKPSIEQPGICLQGQCGNPAQKLMMMAKARTIESGTAAY